jgi:hypothetical protein
MVDEGHYLSCVDEGCRVCREEDRLRDGAYRRAAAEWEARLRRELEEEERGRKYLCVTLEVSVPAGTRAGDLASQPWTATVRGLLPEGAQVTGVAVEHREHGIAMVGTGGAGGAVWQ